MVFKRGLSYLKIDRKAKILIQNYKNDAESGQVRGHSWLIGLHVTYRRHD
jgi:hypothetical protein